MLQAPNCPSPKAMTSVQGNSKPQLVPLKYKGPEFSGNVMCGCLSIGIYRRAVDAHAFEKENMESSEGH